MPQVLIEFVPEFSQLNFAIDQLVSQGVISKEIAAEFKKAQKPVDDMTKKIMQSSATNKKSLDSVKQAVQGVQKSFVQGFKEGVTESLKEAGVSLKQFEDGVTTLTTKERSLKQELKDIKAEMAQLKIEGKENSDRFRELSARGGELTDTMGDVANQLRKIGSDTKHIDGLIEVASGATAAFGIMQGATALFGSENEELQESMMRVQAAMSMMMGVQQIANLLQKESAATTLVTSLQKRAEAAATGLQTAAESKNIVVKGAANIAMKILNMTMKANPVFLLIGAFTALAGAIAWFSSKSKEAAEDTDLLNAKLEYQKYLLSATTRAISNDTKLRVAEAKKRGASEDEIHNITIDGMKREADASKKYADERAKDINKVAGVRLQGVKSAKDAADVLLQVEKTVADAGGFDKLDEASQKRVEATRTLINEIKSGYEKFETLNSDVTISNAEFQADQSEKARDKQKQDNEKAKEQAKKNAEELKRIAEQKLRDKVLAIETELLAVDKGTKAELDAQVRKIQAQEKLDSFGAKSAAERKHIHEKALQDIADLNTEFYKGEQRKAIENTISTYKAELDQAGISNEQRETLTIAMLNKQRELELSEVKNNKAKEKEINAKYDKDIADQRLSIRQASFQEEMGLLEAEAANQSAAINRALSNPDLAASERIGMLQQLEDIEMASIEKRRKFYEKLKEDKLITDKAYNTEMTKLKGQEEAIHADTEAKKTDATKAESEKRKQEFQREVDMVADIAGKVLQAFQGIADALSEREMQRIDAEKQKLEDTRKSGAISEKEYLLRQKRLENEEKAAQVRKAKRDKAMALFTAVIQGAKAVIEAMPNPVMVAITAALVAAQVAAIAARPIPKFGKGTKSAPKGLAIVGETGAEIVQTSQGYYVADHPQVVWMKGGERVYNPKETEAIMTPMADQTIVTATSSANGGSSIDYEKLIKGIGSEMEKHPRNIITIDKEGFASYTMDKGSKTAYLNKRYTLHD